MKNLIKRIRKIDYNILHYVNCNALNNIQAFWDCTVKVGKLENQFHAKRVQIREIQNKNLQAIITYAYLKVKYYKDLFDRNRRFKENPDNKKIKISRVRLYGYCF